ncbi:oligoribonuclease isoform X2 [Vitis vinifera]|uniref:oligoribonuclease isoform X2 n=1 Tax=Vitis vinifera TaxID=29760 RepID=UPI002882ED2C|nr:oligoribonuclease isoform X2 [Vitis vinifera]
MEKLSNIFSVLQLDADDDQLHMPDSSSTTDKKEKKGKSSSNLVPSKNEKNCEQDSMIPSEQYRLPLVWIDLEMTGLNVEVDRILEIACIITDGNLIKSVEGPDLVIHQTKECLDNMGEWCQSHHSASGLTKKVLRSTISEQEAEKQKYMPDLASLFSHVLVDVSSIKALCIRWYPRDSKKAPSKENKHRAMDDIRESIRELKYYRENIFKASKSKK